MLTALIIDDEPFCIEVLETIIKENFPSVKILGEFCDPSLAIEKINEGLHTNLMFIDVNTYRLIFFVDLTR